MNKTQKIKLLGLIAGLSVMGTGYGANSLLMTGAEEAVKTTVGEFFKEILLKPLMISKLQKWFNLDKSKNIKIKAEFMHGIGESLPGMYEVLKDKNPKKVEDLAEKLGTEYNNMLDKLIQLTNK